MDPCIMHAVHAPLLPRWWQLKYGLCSPRKLGKMNPFWRAYFSNGLVQPPTSYWPPGSWWEFGPSCSKSHGSVSQLQWWDATPRGEFSVLTCRKKVKLEELEIEIFSKVASLDVLYDVMAKRCTCDNMWHSHDASIRRTVHLPTWKP